MKLFKLLLVIEILDSENNAGNDKLHEQIQTLIFNATVKFTKHSSIKTLNNSFFRSIFLFLYN